ncbi:MAG: caspase family protein, partial [Cyanobacteria bacterium P01_E01_bin.6]
MSESKKLALLIGVSDYGDGLDALSAPPKDVAALKRVLENPELGGFDPAHVTTLINPALEEMREKIEDLFTRSSKHDLILLYFSGHGITDDNNRLYLTTKHTSKTRYRSRSVPASFIQDLSDDTYAKRQVIILDCCYSGAFAEGWQRKGDVKVEIERELGKEGRVVLTSSSSTQVSFQQEDAELSLYTQYLLEGIEEGAADDNQDGVVTVRELHNYAKKKVQEVKPKMKPDIIVANDEGYDILLSKVKVDVISRFRQLVDEYVDHSQGEIRSRRSQELLEKRAREWNIVPEESDAIIASVLEPTRRRLKNLERYRQEYDAEVQKQYPLSEATLDDLQEWQQEVLGLEDRDVTGIQSAINAIQEQLREASEQQIEAERKRQNTKQQKRIEEERRRQQAEAEAWKQAEQQLEEERRAEQQRIVQEEAAYADNLQRYKQGFTKAVDAEYPLVHYVVDGLKAFQQQLGLKDEDIASIEKPIRDAAEANYHQQLRKKEDTNHRQQHLKEQEDAENRRQQQHVPSSSSSSLQLKTFDFEVVILNDQGQETTRTRKTASYFSEDLGSGVVLDMVKIPPGTFL